MLPNYGVVFKGHNSKGREKGWERGEGEKPREGKEVRREVEFLHLFNSSLSTCKTKFVCGRKWKLSWYVLHFLKFVALFVQKSTGQEGGKKKEWRGFCAQIKN